MNEKQYSPELIAELEELFPDYTKAIELAKQHSLLFKEYIEGSFYNAISVETVLCATSLEELQKEARLIQRKKAFIHKVYKEWDRIKTATLKEKFDN
jgi:hypothetical protein